MFMYFVRKYGETEIVAQQQFSISIPHDHNPLADPGMERLIELKMKTSC
jgi:hypothetical protein